MLKGEGENEQGDFFFQIITFSAAMLQCISWTINNYDKKETKPKCFHHCAIMSIIRRVLQTACANFAGSYSITSVYGAKSEEFPSSTSTAAHIDHIGNTF